MHSLFDQITSPENLLRAWRSVRGNIPKYRRQHSCGPDGVSLLEFERDLASQLQVLQDMLLSGRYQPASPRFIKIPKKNGGSRTLSILNVQDRVAQRAAQQVLEPIWEPVFLDCSFGFRPGVSLDQAITCTQNLRSGGCAWIVDGDIADCFANLDHDQLIRLLRRRIDDRRVIQLLQQWLDVGVMQSGFPYQTSHSLANASEKVVGFLQKSLDWVLETGFEKENPYQAAYYEGLDEQGSGWQSYRQPYPYPSVDAHDLRRRALRQAAANGLLWGGSMVKPALSHAGLAAKTTLSTPAGRRLLRNGAWAMGGLAGTTAAAALGIYYLNRKAGPAPAGVLQGSPLSPLLANIYLHPFDVSMRRAKYNLVRFADDWVICCPDEHTVEQAYNRAILALAHLHLKINPAKTHIRKPGESFEWLGVVIS